MHPPQHTAPNTERETEELIQFRETWKAEIQSRKAESQSRSGDSDAHRSITGKRPENFQSEQDRAPQEGSTTTTSNVGHSLSDPRNPLAFLEVARPPHLAVEIYRRAVELERRSQLDDALRLYRQAFRIDPYVDRAYAKEENIFASSASRSPRISNTQGSTLFEVSPLDELAGSTYNLSVKRTASKTIVNRTLGDLLKIWPNDLVFERNDEKKNTPLRELPDELIVLILRKLDPAAIERFAIVSRKARLVSLDTSIWKELVVMTYTPPQVVDTQALQTIVDQYNCDFRRVYVEHPRVRLDGVYIAVCHYVRAGLSENVWVNVNHLITYHRYLRFFPNGQALSLLTNEELNPQHVIPLLKPTLRMKGLFVGSWQLCDGVVFIDNLTDASSKNTSASSDLMSTRYIYRMTLNLRSRPIGRWNRLDIIEYTSVNVESGDSVPILLKHERPFWFSKVRSYVT